MKQQQTYFLELKKSALQVQQRFRANQLMKIEALKYKQLQLMKKERSQFIAYKALIFCIHL